MLSGPRTNGIHWVTAQISSFSTLLSGMTPTRMGLETIGAILLGMSQEILVGRVSSLKMQPLQTCVHLFLQMADSMMTSTILAACWNEPSDGGKSLTDDSAESSDDSGLDTFTLIGIIGGVVVLALVGVIVVLLKKKPEPKKKKSSPKPLTNLPAPDAPAPAPLPLSEDVDEYGDEAEDENTVGSWEDLPAGDYLDPDENGTNWFKANDGDHWYQNSDGTWTKWQD